MMICRFLSCLGLVLVLLFVGMPAAKAQTLIRDTEIEDDIRGWLTPVFDAAGMSPDQVNIILVQDSKINAFVAGGANIFIYTGLLQKTENPGEVVGVVAHELGHITGGHLIRGREKMEEASYESILGMIVGAGAAIASGDGGAMATIGAGASSMAQRKFLSYSRTFESSADQAAMKYMEAAAVNPSGLESFLKKLEGEELRPTSQQSEYVQTHPLTRNRIDSIDARVQTSAYKTKTYPPEWIAQHKMMLAKLNGFITPEQVAWIYDDRDHSREAITARAIAAYRMNQIPTALKLADQLVALEPSNPYFYELKGQMLMDFGRVKESLSPYQKAISLKPDASLIRISLAHAQIETAGQNPTTLKAAIQNLTLAQKDEPRSPRLHRLMATAYGRMGDEPRAKLHLAEEALLQGKTDYAKSQAEQAKAGLPAGSSDRIRAEDILNFINTKKP